ncbi:MAG: glutaminase [Rhodothermales bacterium]
MDYPEILQTILHEIQPLLGKGRIPDYIPELAQISPDKFGMAVQTLAGDVFTIGDATESFSIQSISKLFTLTLAMQMMGDDIWQRMGREPSGTSFNSLVQLEYEQGIPRNPFINAGALVVTDIILSYVSDAEDAIQKFVQKLASSDDVHFDDAVAQSEKSAGYRNVALANFIKSFGNMENSPAEVLDVYFRHCSLEMNCVDLARAGLFLANSGKIPWSEEQIVATNQAKYIKSLMLTCGTYDVVGDFAYRVGLPSKSGVGGGILAVMPGVFSVCVWSPGLNDAGNSLAGTKALELFTTLTGISIF